MSGVNGEPTYPPPPAEGLAPVLDRNIQAIHARRAREEQAASVEDKVADAISRFTGSMLFVYIHLAIFGVWIVANLHWIPGIPAWDESFVILAMVASVEAIFLSTFVLITQNRMAAAADKRADLDLQISLLTEHELTKIAVLLSDMAKKLSVKTSVQGELDDVKRDVAPDAVLDRIEQKVHQRDSRKLIDHVARATTALALTHMLSTFIPSQKDDWAGQHMNQALAFTVCAYAESFCASPHWLLIVAGDALVPGLKLFDIKCVWFNEEE